MKKVFCFFVSLTVGLSFFSVQVVCQSTPDSEPINRLLLESVGTAIKRFNDSSERTQSGQAQLTNIQIKTVFKKSAISLPSEQKEYLSRQILRLRKYTNLPVTSFKISDSIEINIPDVKSNEAILISPTNLFPIPYKSDDKIPVFDNRMLAPRLGSSFDVLSSRTRLD